MPNAVLASGHSRGFSDVYFNAQAEFNPGGNLLVWQEGKGLIRVTPRSRGWRRLTRANERERSGNVPSNGSSLSSRANRHSKRKGKAWPTPGWLGGHCSVNALISNAERGNRPGYVGSDGALPSTGWMQMESIAPSMPWNQNGPREPRPG